MPTDFNSMSAKMKLAIARCEAITERSRNRDSILKKMAAGLLCSGNAAFLSNAGFGNSPAATITFEINRLGTIEKAQDSLRDFFRHNLRNVDDVVWLDHLLPLNAPAVVMLQAAYEAAGTWRTRDELMERTARAEGTSFSPAREEAA